MITTVDTSSTWNLARYAEFAHLTSAVRELRSEAALLVSQLRDRRVVMVNSTATGGGVAEMMPRITTLLRELGVDTEWMVMGTEEPEFFRLTKRLHNMIHGAGEPGLSAADREVYEAVNRQCAAELKQKLRPDDILVIHDPQPMAMGPILKKELGVKTIWRCHIGHDEETATTADVWEFLARYAESYDASVFSAPEYIPSPLAGRARIIHPALDPCSHKNRDLNAHQLTGVLCNGGMMTAHHPVLTAEFSEPASRLNPNGEFVAHDGAESVGMLYRPIVTQVSRWDRLKGFEPLIQGFVEMKRRLQQPGAETDPYKRRRLELVRLCLAGPDPASISDDPEGREVLFELIHAYKALDPAIQEDIAVLSMPMGSRKENALMINALQRCSTVVVQNSLREGFGLTATEAMWKGISVLGTRACGLRQQIRTGIDGVLVRDPEDPQEIATRLQDLLSNVDKRDAMRRSAQIRVKNEFLVFTQIRDWLRCIADTAWASGAIRD